MNNIPQFLAHLPIWNDTPLDGVRGVTCKYKSQYYKKKTDTKQQKKICVICGQEFYIKNSVTKTKTCSRACGYQVSKLKKEGKWDYEKETPKEEIIATGKAL